MCTHSIPSHSNPTHKQKSNESKSKAKVSLIQARLPAAAMIRFRTSVAVRPFLRAARTAARAASSVSTNVDRRRPRKDLGAPGRGGSVIFESEANVFSLAGCRRSPCQLSHFVMSNWKGDVRCKVDTGSSAQSRAMSASQAGCINVS
jgi:hypothetical protein